MMGTFILIVVCYLLASLVLAGMAWIIYDALTTVPSELDKFANELREEMKDWRTKP